MAPPGGPKKEAAAAAEAAGAPGPGGPSKAPVEDPGPRGPEPGPRAWAAGERCSCKASFDGRLHQAQVVEVREGGGGSPEAGGSGRAYVHYLDFNKRLDEWVALESLQSPGEAAEAGGASGPDGAGAGGAGGEAGAAGAKPGSGGGTRGAR